MRKQLPATPAATAYLLKGPPLLSISCSTASPEPLLMSIWWTWNGKSRRRHALVHTRDEGVTNGVSGIAIWWDKTRPRTHIKFVYAPPCSKLYNDLKSLDDVYFRDIRIWIWTVYMVIISLQARTATLVSHSRSRLRVYIPDHVQVNTTESIWPWRTVDYRKKILMKGFRTR
jgi:hypothetical protein